MAKFCPIWSHWNQTCGLYYKPVTIVNDDARVVNKLEASLIDDARVIIYDRHMFIVQATESMDNAREHCTIDLLFDWFGISCMTTDKFCFHLQNRLIQTSQTGGQWYRDTSPFSIP
jgi:hypothetical protein